MRGHPVLGAVSGFLFGFFLGISLFLWGVVRLDSEWLVILPFVGLALPLTAVVNALMALPFALRALAPALAGIEADFGRLADSLNLKGAARLRWLILPRLTAPLGFTAGLAAALSVGVKIPE